MDFCIGAGKQGVGWIGHINFNQQSASRHVDGVSSAYQASLKCASGKLSESKVRGHAGFDSARVFFRDVYVNAQRARLSDMEEIGFYIGVATRINKVADIGVARRDHT